MTAVTIANRRVQQRHVHCAHVPGAKEPARSPTAPPAARRSYGAGPATVMVGVRESDFFFGKMRVGLCRAHNLLFARPAADAVYDTSTVHRRVTP
jgi:hypothetical protein